jgi:hypothetical protein
MYAHVCVYVQAYVYLQYQEDFYETIKISQQGRLQRVKNIKYIIKNLICLILVCHTNNIKEITLLRPVWRHKIGPDNKKRKDKGHEPVRLKNFTALTKS